MEQAGGICELILIAPDPYTQEQVRIACGAGDQWRLRVEDEPSALLALDSHAGGRVYLAASSYLRTIGNLPRPLIVHGPVSDLPLLAAHRFDDYLAEPWTGEELRFRADRLIPSHTVRLRSGILVWDRTSLEGIGDDGHRVRARISPGQAMMLDLLVRSRSDPVPRDALAAVSVAHLGDGRALDMSISRLRRALAEVTDGWELSPVLAAVRREGYLLTG